ncbi:hypothetical protein [Agrococcus sp. KRD186]|jgi:hypothetical protein|uniref:hypothetical protein n=1 Tax=Agrococcus sp. KRD186 TaxID=2729730 RepID=UPI0019D0EB3D|nr:hypothetical protein [Agrococcus sp. KRD186]
MGGHDCPDRDAHRVVAEDAGQHHEVGRPAVIGQAAQDHVGRDHLARRTPPAH